MKFKKILSVILCMMFLISPVSAFATENTTNTVYSETNQESKPPGEPDNVDFISADTYSNPIVANISVVTRIKSITGHAWLYIQNVSTEPITVGHLTVNPGEGVSVGLFSWSRADGWGIYYNVEAYCCNKHSNSGCFWLTEEITASELENVSKQIKNYLNHWDPFFNCVFFSFTIWNSISNKKLIPLVMPIFGTAEMLVLGASSGNFEMFYPIPENVFRQKGTGDNAKLINVSEKTLNNSI